MSFQLVEVTEILRNNPLSSYDFKSKRNEKAQVIKEPKMKLSLKTLSTLSAFSVVLAPAFLGAGSASAQPVRFDGSYIGAGASAGVTNGGRDNDAAVFGGNVQGRFAVPGAPVSVRGSVLFTGDNSAVIPSLTYDLPLNSKTNVYGGAGYSFVQNNNRSSQIGNKDSAVLTVGVESQVAKGVVVYSDAKYGINAYQGSGAGSLSVNAGVGLQF